MIHKDILQQYNQQRKNQATSKICHAPFVNLNFEQNGNITACCFNRTHILGTFPKNSIAEAWEGEKSQELRNEINKNSLKLGCIGCEELLIAKDFTGVKTLYYDEYAENETFGDKLLSFISKSKKPKPRVFEFELENTCNLQCTMCNGYFSSSIRNHRENLPPIISPYNDEFVSQVTAFLPHLSDAKFLGGEPFLIPIYYKIWDSIIEHNPKIKVHITTNASILNKKVKNYLDKLNANIIVSIDSINRECYESIRIGANFDSVWENVNYLLQYTRDKNSDLAFAVCPMSSNLNEMPEIIAYCNKEGIYIHFNTVWNPEHLSPRYMSPSELNNAIEAFKILDLPNESAAEKHNKKKLNDLISLLEYWQRLIQIENRDDLSKLANNFLKFEIEEIEEMPENQKLIFKQLLEFYLTEIPSEISEFSTLKSYLSTNSKTNQIDWQEIVKGLGHKEFLENYYKCLHSFAQKSLTKTEFESFAKKLELVSQILQNPTMLQEVANEVVRTGFLFQFNYVHHMESSQLQSQVSVRFSE